MQRWLAVGILGATVLRPLAADSSAAVLPFFNRSAPAFLNRSAPQNRAAANLDWIGESIAETVREALGARGVMALERKDVQDAYARLNLKEGAPLTEASVMKIGEALDAEYAVYGAFAFSPTAEFSPAPQGPVTAGSLRITTRVFDRRHMRESPEFAETGSLVDLATLEAHLAWQTLNLIAPNLAPPESDFRTLRASIRLDAEENYIRGLLARAPEEKEKYFLQAARLDARFSHPCYQLGQMHYQRKEYRQAAVWLEKVGSGDIHFREASFLLGLARFQSGDYAGAQKAFQGIAAAVPLSEVYNNLGAAESRANSPAAFEDFRKALEGDPNDPVYHFNLGYVLWKKGEFTAAAERFRSALDRDSQDQMAALLLARCTKKQGPRSNPDARLDGLERLKSNYDERAYRQLKSLLSPQKLAPSPKTSDKAQESGSGKP